MKIVITGSSGRVGQAVSVRLRRRHDVYGFDRTPASVTDTVADIMDREALGQALRGAGAVIHAAALHAPHVSHAAASTFRRVNVEGTRAVVAACLEAGVRTLVFTSTTALYGSASTPADRAGWVTEESRPIPRTIYHRTKLAAESLLREVAACTPLRVTVLRMSRCFPEAADLMAAYRLHRGVDARDVAAAHELALLSSGEPFRVFVVSGATPFAADDVVALKSDAPGVLRRRAPALVAAFAVRHWPLPAAIDRVYCADRAHRELGWTPRFGYREVLRQYDAESAEVLPPPVGAPRMA